MSVPSQSAIGNQQSAISSLQSAIDLAAARAFLYRFVAEAFRYPEAEGWSWLCNPATHWVARMTARTLAEPDRPDLAQRLEALLQHFSPDQFDAFNDDYIAAFGHAARGICPLNEIEYGDLKADALFQPHRLADLAAFYRAFGLEITEDATERQDHLCVELEFMSALAAKEAYGLEHQFDEPDLAVDRDAQKKFLREHLGRWTPAFTRRLARAVGDCALGDLAHFTGEFIAAECQRFGVMPGSEDLALRPADESAQNVCAGCGLQNLPPGALSATPQV
jgi:DMSO reductase family type II enzyme chaperone